MYYTIVNFSCDSDAIGRYEFNLIKIGLLYQIAAIERIEKVMSK